MKKLSIWTLVVVVLIGAAFLFFRYFNSSENPEQGYKTSPVERGQIQAIVTSTGTVNPLNTVKVGSQISGNIMEIYVDFNSVVKKDQVIARIDEAVYEAQLNQAKAQLLMAQMQLMERQKDIVAAQAGIESAMANLNSAKATLRETELQYNRIAKLRDNITVSQSQLDEVLARRDNARGAVEIAKAKVETSKAQLQRAQAQEKGVRALIAEREAALKLADVRLKYCTIKSPIDGEVIERAVDVGQTVAATLQSPVLFTIAENLARMQVEVDVSEADVGQIKPEQNVEFNVDAFPEKKFRAKVRQVRNFATEIQNVVTYKVIADVNNDSLLLRPGMTANVTIITAKVDDILKIPNAALRFKPPGEIKEAKSQKRPPTKETDFFKNTVKKVDLDSNQAKELVKFIDAAGIKLKAAYALPEEDRDLKQAWRGFFVQVFTNLYKILREDQHEKFRAYTAELKAAQKKRQMYKGRPAKVYILDKNGQHQILDITAGITNDSETQIIRGDLKEGDKVIVGLAFGSDGALKRPSNIISSIFRRR